MKGLVTFGLGVISCSVVFAKELPNANLYFLAGVPSTVLVGKTLEVPVLLDYMSWSIRGFTVWHLPANVALVPVSGPCPSVMSDNVAYWYNQCLLRLVIGSDSPGIIAGSIIFSMQGMEGTSPDDISWNKYIVSPGFVIEVIPHNLSMSVIPIQEATANQDFNFNIKNYVNYYDENVKANSPAQGVVEPLQQDGLYYDAQTFSVKGTPTRTGLFHFDIGVKNKNGESAKTALNIQVAPNLKDKPKFKNIHYLNTATPESKYSMNLMALIDSTPELIQSNQISFAIDTKKVYPSWLHISENESTLLEGDVPLGIEGTEPEVTLIATSNTGGKSSVTVNIPIAFDPEKKPVFEYFEMKSAVLKSFSYNLQTWIKDPANDSTLKAEIVKIEPHVTWMTISENDSLWIHGSVPDDAAGQTFQVTLRAITQAGGSSDLITIPLIISINKELMPRFKEDNPIFPLMHPGQPYFYDFVENRDIFPEFDSEPYEIHFADGYDHPNWLRMENNKLVADLVPLKVESFYKIYLVLKNIPGGPSGAIPLRISVMN